MRNAIRPVVALTGLLALANCGSPGGSVTGGAGSVTDGAVRLSRQADMTAQHGGRITPISPPGCPIRAVYVRFDTEIRGYPLDADGLTVPCARIAGVQTLLVERGPIAVSVHGNLHSLSFQALYGLTIQRRYANGDASPNRAVVVAQDHVALAVDSSINDFVVGSEGYEGDNCWYVVPDKAVRATTQHCDVNVTAIHALTTDSRDELIAVGTDATTGESRIDVFAGPASPTPRLVRSITGAATGLPKLAGTQGYFDVTYSLAADPRSNELYVYSDKYNILGEPNPAPPAPKISEFRADANGNVAPRRVLQGPKLNLPPAAFTVNLLGSDDRGNLFAVTSGATAVVSVFGPNAQGNVAADRTFSDPTAPIGFEGASLATRTAVR